MSDFNELSHYFFTNEEVKKKLRKMLIPSLPKRIYSSRSYQPALKNIKFSV